VRGIRSNRKGEAEEAVGTKLQTNRGQNNRAPGRRFNVCVGQPGMNRPHRHLDGKGNQEGEEYPYLWRQFQREFVPLENRKAAAGLEEQVHLGNQKQKGAKQRVEENLNAA
jgi:hypothetical protein